MEFDTAHNLGEKIRTDLVSESTKKSIVLLFAFNATGKTRLSLALDERSDEDNETIRILSYNVLLEDCFTWDNENFIYKFEPSLWFFPFIIEQGIEAVIADNFKTITDSKIEPTFDFDAGEVTFSIATGDEATETNIKISRGEESVFVWCVFYSVIEIIIETLGTEVDLRTTQIFNSLELIVIDDPVSSIDDVRIISIAVKLFETIKASTNPQLNFLITTHHALFYNVLHNSLGRGLKDSKANRFFYILSKNPDDTLLLNSHSADNPFAYHLSMKSKLAKAVEDGYIEKYHFNLFRGLLEKTANFLGYTNWSDCVLGEGKMEFVRIVNHYSHQKLSELESSVISEVDKQLFIETFRRFIADFNYR